MEYRRRFSTRFEEQEYQVGNGGQDKSIVKEGRISEREMRRSLRCFYFLIKGCGRHAFCPRAMSLFQGIW